MQEQPRSFGLHNPEDLVSQAAWIRRLAAALVGEDRADDLAQDTWLVALRQGGEARSLGPWLRGAARRLARFQARGEANRRAREHEVAPEEALPSPEQLAQRAELQRILVEAVLELEEPYRATLLLRFYEGLAPAEIARRRREPGATVRSRLRRGLAKLREELDRRHGGTREGWLAVLTPLSSTPLYGGWIVKGTTLAALGAAAGLAVMVGLWVLRGDDSASGAGDTGTGSESISSLPDPPPNPKEDAGGANEVASPATGAGQTARESLSGSESAVEPPRPGAAPLEGRVVDALTGEPLPHYRFTVAEPEGKALEVLADESGRFATERSYGHGPLRLELRDSRHPKNVIQGNGREAWEAWEWFRAHEHGADAGPIDLALPAGPTYGLRIQAPPEVEIDGLHASLRAADMRFANDYIYGTVRGGSAPWVRFSPVTTLMGGGPPYRLMVMTDDGYWFGEARVDAVIGAYAGLVDLELEPRGAVLATITRHDGDPLDNTWVQLWGEGATLDTGDPNLRPQFVLAEGGRAHGRWLHPGPYTVKIKANGHAAFEEQVEVIRGETAKLELQLAKRERRKGDGVVRGRVVSRTGRFEGPLALQLRADDGGTPRSVRVRWKEQEGVFVGTFEAKRLPRVPSTLYAATEGFLAVHPATLQVTPDAEGLEFLVEDDFTLDAVHLEVVDGETGQPVPEFRAWLTVEPRGDERFRYFKGSAGRLTVEDVPTDLPWQVRVLADGYTHTWAGSELGPEPDEDGVTRVALRRGWSSQVIVRDPDRRLLSGVDVFLDGELVGRTVDGLLAVYRDSAPSRIELQYGDWTPVGDSTLDPASGRFRSHLYWVHAVMQPPR